MTICLITSRIVQEVIALVYENLVISTPLKPLEVELEIVNNVLSSLRGSLNLFIQKVKARL